MRVESYERCNVCQCHRRSDFLRRHPDPRRQEPGKYAETLFLPVQYYTADEKLACSPDLQVASDRGYHGTEHVVVKSTRNEERVG